MAQQEISGRSNKGKEVGEVNGEGQTRSNTSSTSWLIEIERALDPLPETWHVSKNVCIYRVPKPIIISNSRAYAPFAVTFGPYHHKINPELSVMYQHKLEAVHRTLARLKTDVTSLIAKINELEIKIRDCYEEPIAWDRNTLSWMFAMDACFILEWFKCSSTRRQESDTDCFSLVFQRKGYENTLHRAIEDDIMKLENQIPLFVLTTLLQLEFGTREHAIVKLTTLVFYSEVFWGYPFTSSLSGVGVKSELQEHFEKLKNYIKKDPCHLLDLYRMVVKDLLTHSNSESNRDDRYTPSPTPTPPPDDDRSSPDDRGGCKWSMNVTLPGWMQRLSCNDILPRLSRTHSPDDSRFTPSAELLHKTGIEFKPGQLGFKKRWFGKSTLFFPQITVEDRTETLLRNLMAYEECQRCSWKPEEPVISHYVILLDDLIDSEKDVSVLRKSLVIQSFLGSDDDIARMFNRLGDGITFDGLEEIDKVMKDSREHYKSLRKVWMSQFKEEHCSKPWYVLSLVGAIFILGMTAVQTVYSVKK